MPASQVLESVSLLVGASQVMGWPHEALQLDLALFVFFLVGGKGSDFFVYYKVCSIKCIFSQVMCIRGRTIGSARAQSHFL